VNQSINPYIFVFIQEFGEACNILATHNPK